METVYQAEQPMEQLIKFMDVDMRDVQYPYDDALILIMRITNHNMHRMLIDNGSSVNILS